MAIKPAQVAAQVAPASRTRFVAMVFRRTAKAAMPGRQTAHLTPAAQATAS